MSITKNVRIRRMIALLLIICFIMPESSRPSFAAEVYDDHLDGWKVECVWSDLSYDLEKYSENEHTFFPRMVFSYRLENAEHDYEPGSVRVEIPGIGNACRNEIVRAACLPTDSEDSEWDVSWDQLNDIYTFSNRFRVEEGQSVNGGFDIAWKLDSRKVQHGFSQKRSPVFHVSGAGSIALRPLGFSYSSVRDRYNIHLNRGTPNSAMSEAADDEHLWYCFQVSFEKTWLSRGLDLSTCCARLILPEAMEPTDTKVVDERGKEVSYADDGQGELSFNLFENRRGDIGEDGRTVIIRFMAGFPKGSVNGEEVSVQVHLDRLYKDEPEWMRTACEGESVDDGLCLTADEYDFSSGGMIYRIDMWNEAYENFYRAPSYYWYDYEDELSHMEPPDYGQRLDARDIYNGKVVEFTLFGRSQKDTGPAVSAYAAATPSDAGLTAKEAVEALKAGILPVASLSEAQETPTILRTGEDEGYAMVLGDDALAVFLEDGSIRALEDDEYDLAYISIPFNLKGYGYGIYGAERKDLPFDEYKLLASSDMSASRTFAFPEGIKAAFVKIEGISGNFSTDMSIGVSFHLDWNSEMKKDASWRCDHENRLVNFSFFRSLSKDRKGGEKNDCEVTAEQYGGTYGEELAARDMELYGECLLRDYSNVWIRGTSTSLRTTVSVDPFKAEDEGYSTEARVSGTVRSDSEGELMRFSLYTVLPDGLKADFYSGSVTVSGSLTAKNGGAIEDPADHVSFSEGVYNGRKMIIADFDLTDHPLMAEASNRVNISYPLTLSYADQASLGESYTITSYLLPHDPGMDKITGPAIISDDRDIDGNGITTEKMAYASAKITVEKGADEWREFVSKYVKTAFSEGYVRDAATCRAAESGDDLYEYRLDLGLGTSDASDIIFYDHLEQGANIAPGKNNGTYDKTESEWQGEFCSIDTSYAESLGFKSTVYYSANEDEPFDLSSPGWSSSCPQDLKSVRSIAVAIDTSGLSDGLMHSGSFIYITVKMRAPKDEKFLGKSAVNQYTVNYDRFGMNGGNEGKSILSSSATKLTLLDSVGRIILEKVDADNVLRVDAEGRPRYATLTGASFQIYDAKGNALFETPQAVNNFGRLVVDNVSHGTYYWEEVSAPKGYEKISGRHAFNVDGTGGIVLVQDHRLTGKVTLTKYDQDSADPKPLRGAVYELFNGKGEKVFTDAGYNYLRDGDNSVFETGSGQSFTVSGLPWGDYEFREVSPPSGYGLSESPVTFTIGKDLYDDESREIAISISAYDTQETAGLRLIKIDARSGEGLDGGIYSLYRTAEEEGGSDICIASGLKTDKFGRIETDGLKFGTYYFTETMNPAGYLLPDTADASTDKVTLDETTAGNVIELKHEDERMKGRVRLCKYDDTGLPVPGAEFDLYQLSEDGSALLIGSFITGTDRDEDGYGEIYTEGLEWGDYCFKEIKAPEGYELSEEDVRFEVNRETVQNIIELKALDNRMCGTVRITKKDRHDSESLLSGAEFALYHNSGEPCTAGVDYELPGGGDLIITGDDGSVTITGLKQGAYFLKETVAPSSYSLSGETIRFSVTMENAGLVQELLVEDDKDLAVLTIDKEVNDVCGAFGDPTFIFKITRSDGAVNFASITLAPSVLEGSVSLNLERGHTYTVEEIGISRYKNDSVTALKNAVVDEERKTAAADLDSNTEAEVRFSDLGEQYEKFSHSANVINTIKSSARLTAVTVRYLGPDPLTGELPGYDQERESYVIPDEDLEVCAFYDDGTSEILPAGEYVLTPDCADGNSDSYTGTVSVSRNGVRRTASFSVSVSLPVPTPRYTVQYELDGGRIVPPGEVSSVDTYIMRVKEGTVVNRPENDPVRENFRFTGWFKDKKSGIPAKFPFTVTKDTVIYAGWEAEPVEVRYAVSLYGIWADTDGQGNTAGLTFGPALGCSWLNSSRSHVPSEGKLCLHDMSWDEIAELSMTAPDVFEECLINGCTHAVDLTIKGALAENAAPLPQRSGDGSPVVLCSVNDAYLKWNETDDEVTSYAGSELRKVLNGGADGIEFSLADALPAELREAIQKKMGDELWLFSVDELFPDASTDIRDGDLYERQRIWGTDEKNMTGYDENGRAASFWLRSALSSGNPMFVTEDGSYREGDVSDVNGLAFGFCLPGPKPATRLAVSLYGIRHDNYREENGNQGIAGLTFGPAVGGDYRESYVSHTPKGTSGDGNAHRCIHDDDWDTIAEWSLKDPYVYEECLGDKDTPGCTKGIDIFRNDQMTDETFSFSGDGSSALYRILPEDKRSFFYSYDYNNTVVNDGGWPASLIRAFLNGADVYTNKLCDGSPALTLDTRKPSAGEDPPGEKESIFNCLPPRLREHIVPKAVVSDTLFDDVNTTDHTMITYDRLWLFSAREIWAEGREVRANEGTTYEKQAIREVESGGDPNMAIYGEKGRTGISLRSLAEKNRYEHLTVNEVTSSGNCDVSMGLMGIGFGFCLR